MIHRPSPAAFATPTFLAFVGALSSWSCSDVGAPVADSSNATGGTSQDGMAGGGGAGDRGVGGSDPGNATGGAPGGGSGGAMSCETSGAVGFALDDAPAATGVLTGKAEGEERVFGSGTFNGSYHQT